MTISFEIDREHADKRPPFTDGCETCSTSGFAGVVVPYATFTQGDSLIAFYHHGRCDREWYTSWSAQWDWTWKRVGPDNSSPKPVNGRGQLRALPSPGQSA